MLDRNMLAAAAVAGLVAFAGPVSAATRVYALAAQNGSTEAGTVTLTSLGEKTRVVVALVNAPADVPQPAHIHEGPCAKLNPKPMYPLSLVLDGVSTSVVEIPLAQLVAGGFAVNVHKSTSDIPAYVACGDLGAKK